MLGEQVCIILYKEIIRLLVSDHVDRILQIALTEKRVKYFPFFVLNPCLINAASVKVKESVSTYKSQIVLTISASSGTSFNLQAFFVFPSTVMLFYSFGFKAGRGCTT